MSDTKTKSADIGILRKVYGLITPYRHLFIIAITITFINSFVGPAIPYAIRHTIDNEILRFNTNGLYLMAMLIFGLMLLQAVLTYFETFMTNDLGQNAIKMLREKVYDHILNFKSKVFDKTPIGTLITRTITDVERVADIFSQGLINIVGDLLQLVIIIGVMFYTDWQLSLVVLSIFPLLLISSYVFKEKVKHSFQDVRTQVARLNAFLQEHITGMQIIQIFNKEKQELKKFNAINQKHRDANIRAVLYYSVFFPVIEILSSIAIALLVWYGTKGILSQELTFGTLVLFILYINMMFRPIRQITNNFNTLQMGMVASERIFKVLDIDDSIPNKGKVDREIEGSIEFRNVNFEYEQNEPILKNIDFKVAQGQTLAIVGATGAGKTTITNLLNRMYDIPSGDILFDGINAKDYELKCLRRQIAVVLQDVFLFSDSIMNNIKLFNESISQKSVEEAAELIGADRFIKQLPGGYDYVVQERGATLSAGQRQMVSFLRAIIQNPKILILDEATSSVDNETEELIQQAIEILLRGRTSIVIAHRLSTVQHAEQIIVLDKGEIKERGNHKELMAQDGLYRKLIKLQFTELAI